MRNKSIVAIVALMLLTGLASAGEPLQQAGYYEGTIGRHPIVMTLGPNLNQDGNAGQYRYLEYGPPIALMIEKREEHGLALEEIRQSTGKAVARISGQFTDDPSPVLIGDWTSGDGKRRVPISLQRIATMTTLSVEDAHYLVQNSFPKFDADTPFHQAMNELLAKQAKDAVEQDSAEMARESGPPSGGAAKLDHFTTVEVLHSDESMVSLLVHTYQDYSGKEGVDEEYWAGTYVWRDGHVVELNNGDLISESSYTHISKLLSALLTGDKSPWSNGRVLVRDWEINPTSVGFLFTFGPHDAEVYAAGSTSVCIPYRSIDRDIPAASPAKRIAER